MNRVVILSECGFTRGGLTALLAPTCAIFSTPDSQTCLTHMVQRERVTLVILSVSNRTALAALIRLVGHIRHYQPHCKVLLDPGAVSVPLLRFYFNHLYDCVGTIDLAQPVSTLLQNIVQVMSRQTELSAEMMAGQDQLSCRERSVLSRVIKEMSHVDIARALKLSVKTVSHYKRAGLLKLGARNMQGLLSPATSTISAQNRDAFRDLAEIPPVNNTATTPPLTAGA